MASDSRSETFWRFGEGVLAMGIARLFGVEET